MYNPPISTPIFDPFFTIFAIVNYFSLRVLGCPFLIRCDLTYQDVNPRSPERATKLYRRNPPSFATEICSDLNLWSIESNYISFAWTIFSVEKSSNPILII